MLTIGTCVYPTQLSEKDTVLVKYTDEDGDLVTILDNGTIPFHPYLLYHPFCLYLYECESDPEIDNIDP